jgi:hypothetical protein
MKWKEAKIDRPPPEPEKFVKNGKNWGNREKWEKVVKTKLW